MDRLVAGEKSPLLTGNFSSSHYSLKTERHETYIARGIYVYKGKHIYYRYIYKIYIIIYYI